jgi:hypothetical protein
MVAGGMTFRVSWDGHVIAGITRVSALRVAIDVIQISDGGAAGSTRSAPGRTRYEPITLERGLTSDAEFERWANESTTPAGQPESVAVDRGVTHDAAFGDWSRAAPARAAGESVSVERGVTHDSAFGAWATRPLGTPGDPRKTILIEVLDDAGARIRGYQVFHCWVSAYQALPELNTQGTIELVESITLEHAGWAREP